MSPSGRCPAWFIGTLPGMVIGDAAPAWFKEEVELVNIQEKVEHGREGISTFVVSWISLRTSSSKLLLAFTAFPRCYSPSFFPR
ncbi:hypothetical protein RchiOBHm_Chr6g0270351 [Rosa chinensis]|uniref:Uncharacterized protein n=1 Tax=Rosa chinensis TaxID=74649 RepID=A0A2P6PQQ1_ROSCH|nr:hypothetical protein RchiOBHm_Chr6g0270351 [Rosa chinensis]